MTASTPAHPNDPDVPAAAPAAAARTYGLVVRDREQDVHTALTAIEHTLDALRQRAPAEAVVALGTARQLAVHADELIAALAGLRDLREVSFLIDAQVPPPADLADLDPAGPAPSPGAGGTVGREHW